MPPKIEPGMDPLQAKFRENMQAAFGALCTAFPGVGLALFLFDPDDKNPRANYISNCERPHVNKALTEFLERQKT